MIHRPRAQAIRLQHICESSQIIEVAGKSAPPADQSLELMLPTAVIRDEDLRAQIESGNEDALTHFVRQLTGDAIREGITLGTTRQGAHGLRIQVLDENVQIELTDETICEVLSQHLLPRFRAIMRQA